MRYSLTSSDWYWHERSKRNEETRQQATPRFMPMFPPEVEARSWALQQLAFRRGERAREAQEQEVQRTLAGVYLAAEFAAGLDE